MYTAFGLGASLKKVLNFGNMLLYAEYVVDNFEFPRGLASIQDDMFQVNLKVKISTSGIDESPAPPVKPLIE